MSPTLERRKRDRRAAVPPYRRAARRTPCYVAAKLRCYRPSISSVVYLCLTTHYMCLQVDRFGSIDPYIKATWDDSELGQSDVKWKSQRPRFDYHIQINFETSSEDAELVLEVYDKDKVGDDDFISQVVLARGEVDDGSTIQHLLHPRLHPTTSPSHQPTTLLHHLTPPVHRG